MPDIYLIMLIILAGLAITDLVVGVSNDAVNFLNSAIGSKAINFKTIMIIASVGIAFGALSSSGMMEVARKGIFIPSQFDFSEVMIIFMAVMITDVLLLDFFNTMGLPTSTTVSIVFELLGAAVCMSLIKISQVGEESFLDLGKYIESDKALQIIMGILLSVVIAFTIGALVQFISRLMLTFDYRKRPAFFAGIFGGLSLTSLFYFIIVKGLKGADLGMVGELIATTSVSKIITISAIFWTLFSFVYVILLKKDIYKLIIIMGTFGLAMAFAGNDLVNFIGVPIGAYQAYEYAITQPGDVSGVAMDFLGNKLPSNKWLLVVAGVIMVATLWFSSKAQAVVKTSVDLARQDTGTERFKANALSRFLVRYSLRAAEGIQAILPEKTSNYISSRFEKVAELDVVPKHEDKPAFDYVRASVNLMVAAILISVATSYKLPLSTTYVTFMVAMGTSLADRAWGTESAVYRIAGVINVIGGWFFTAFSAFTAAAIMAYLIYITNNYAIFPLIILAVLLLYRSYLAHKKSVTKIKETDELKKAESKTIQGIIHESSDNVSMVFKRSKRIYNNTLEGLMSQDLSVLKSSKKESNKLGEEIDDLRNNIFYFIKNLDEQNLGASKFYIEVLGHLQDMTQSLDLITKNSTRHISNNHKSLKFNQMKDLKEVITEVSQILRKAEQTFKNKEFSSLDEIIRSKRELLALVDAKIDRQVKRTKDDEQSPKNTTLYFSLLLETRDLIETTMQVVEEYYIQYDKKVDLE
ncbi:probable low-affinity inorganic phosphate transporter [Nonlabens tegetincola]|uniref:Phosphate transporter n=1 Tax=Nonlabens tegetincola TaxID=323273 RepID=A0A090PXZ1_9FLAO|nr:MULTISPECIES: inorganic phosphate transporter [Nonlabens]ALM20848.1 phosphate:sodium symporter [Nonlabens sp. MIC269]GAK95630.1 probable low-affinity inorganic phosphate transporter [Nonlabens tegetincola]